VDRSRLAVVIPCHNESATVGQVAAGARAYGHVLVIDDRSTDASRAVAEAAGAEVIASATPGYDGALTTGFKAARARGFEFVATLDADGEHDPAVLAQVAQALGAGASLVCGIRPAPQRAAEHWIAMVGRWRFGVRDLLCGMKAYSAPVLDAWLASGVPLSVNMAPAVMWRKAGGGLAEVRVTGERRVGRPRFGRAMAANLTLLRAFRAVAALPPAKRRP
jgi:glycosyltransferase involved in cell wall biosynthesis